MTDRAKLMEILNKGEDLPMLYKMDKKGTNIRKWGVKLNLNEDGTTYTITTEYGIKDGNTTNSSSVVSSGKNIGRSNVTTIEEQAKKDTVSKYISKIKNNKMTADYDELIKSNEESSSEVVEAK